MKRTVARIILALAAAFALVSGCDCNRIDPEKTGYDRVLIMYSAGYNSLCDYLREDIEDLKKGYVPGEKDTRTILIVSHLAESRDSYGVTTYPQLIRLYKDNRKGILMDTLKTYTGNLSEPVTMKRILTDIQQQFPSKHYGMVFSSHATGWMPVGYYLNPSLFDSSASLSGKKGSAVRNDFPPGTFPYVERELLPGEPLTKSLTLTNGTSTGTEMELIDFKNSIPMHLDYMLMDACLMGCIEVAYELKDVCDKIGFSQAEILADGFNYKNLLGHLLEKEEPDLRAVVDDYYQQYAAKTDKMDRSATISLVDCTKLTPLALTCGTLFSKYRNEIRNLEAYNIQRYYRYDKHWFYDLEDVLVHAGISDEEHRSLTSALDGCIVYKAATEEFLRGYGGFYIRTFSGLSMYLPCNGSAYLDSHYKDLSWNKSTGLVE